MKSGLVALMVTALSLAIIPAASHAAPASGPQAQPVALSAAPEELPFTPRFANLLTNYRNCVLLQVDEGLLGAQREMAREAMSACALSRGELRAQLISDLAATRPALDQAAAQTTAEAGLVQLDPMIEAVAVDQAHLRYARNMY
jgi:hypothetical protein